MRLLPFILLIGALLCDGAFAQDSGNDKEKVFFRSVDVFVESKTQPLAAYQVQVAFLGLRTKISGIEGGDHPAFKNPPLYDPKAMQKEQVIIAAYNTGPAEELPKGKVRVATIHLQITGSKAPDFSFKLITAGTMEGQKIPAKVAVKWRKKSREDRQ